MKEILHVFGQAAHHDEVFLAGNREALLSLRRAIDEALENKIGECEASVCDGEGFSSFVLCAEDKQLERLAVPYSADYAQEKDPSATPVYDLYRYLLATVKPRV